MAAVLSCPASLMAQSPAERGGGRSRTSAAELAFTVEAGFLGVLHHEIRLGPDGTTLDLRDDAGQDVLEPFFRASVDLTLAARHVLTVLYQPLLLDTREELRRTVRIDGQDFDAGTPLRTRYSFPFYRFGWAYDVLADDERVLALGAGLQIRNANIEFSSLDGTRFRRRSDIGLVPLLRARGMFPTGERTWFGFEVDGFYAPIRWLNVSDRDVEGAILDASARIGLRSPAVRWADWFLNLRYFGGGASSENDDVDDQRNWLHLIVLSLGMRLLV
jgi:hypothetical protein